jgi:urease beta subunit
MVPGEYFLKSEPIELNANRVVTKIAVTNTGDRPVQVGSHYHFFEVNDMLEFTRELALGKRLNIPAATAVRFEPGEEKEIELVSFGGDQHIFGFHNRVNGPVK